MSILWFKAQIFMLLKHMIILKSKRDLIYYIFNKTRRQKKHQCIIMQDAEYITVFISLQTLLNFKCLSDILQL
jgi:hypothetical protein